MPGKQTRFSLIFLALVVAGLLLSCARQPTDESGPTPVLTGAPPTALPMPPADAQLGWVFTDGRRAKLADYHGKVLVLDFYATWCEPCRRSIPHLIGLHRSHKQQGLEILGLNVGGPDDRIKVAAFAQELQISYPLGFPDQAMIDLFLSDNQTIPQTFVFSKEGKLVKRLIGFDQPAAAELDKVLETELAVR